MGVTERILALMKKRNIKAAQLTREALLSSGAVTQWKKGLQNPSTDAIIKLSTYFNVTTDWLLTGKDPSGNESVLSDELTPEQALRVLGVNDKSNAKLIAKMIEYAKENG